MLLALPVGAPVALRGLYTKDDNADRSGGAETIPFVEKRRAGWNRLVQGVYLCWEGNSVMINNTRNLCAFWGAAALLIAFAVGNPAMAGGVVHRVTVGSPDACEAFGDKPGCDANNSLIALQFDDGTVTGRLTDRFYTDPSDPENPLIAEGIHGEVTCLVVEGNKAWISGTAWYFSRGKVEEFPFFVRVVDNGTSANDPPDEISFTMGRGRTCEDIYQNTPYDRPVFPVPQGQVTVK